MAVRRVITSTPNLVGGVSQQPPALRLPQQVEAMEDYLPDVVQGCVKRPPTQHVKELAGPMTGSQKVHWINRSPTERYVVQVGGDTDPTTDGFLKVWDDDGT
ncbi:unnamed protein product, partial [marine sediment metagenome]